MHSSLYSVPHSSGRRRRLAIAINQERDSESQGEGQQIRNVNSILKFRPSPSTPDIEFQKFLATAPPLTWVFAGDSLTTHARRALRGGTFWSYLEGMVRDVMVRDRDIFISSASHDVRIVDLWNHYEDRVGRFQPDVLVLTCGLRELSEMPESAIAFERHFQELLDRARDEWAVTIVNTPPYLISSQHQSSDHLVRLEAIRACAIESGAFVVDHWERWQQGAAADWYRSDGFYPSDRGFIKMARLFVKQFKLQEIADLREAGQLPPEISLLATSS